MKGLESKNIVSLFTIHGPSCCTKRNSQSKIRHESKKIRHESKKVKGKDNYNLLTALQSLLPDQWTLE